MPNLFFEKTKKDLTGCMEKILADLLPGGRIQGNEYVCASSAGGKGESCSTNIITGIGSDFATGEKWGDIIDMAAQVWQLPQYKTAKLLIEKYLNNEMKSNDVLLVNTKDARYFMDTSVNESKTTVIMPIPDSSPLPFAGSQKPSMQWCYRNDQDKPLFYIARYDKPAGNKIIRPRSYARNRHGNESWQWKYPPSPRPLYNLKHLATNQDKPVLLVEGEKAADKAQKIFPDYVVMTWSGGANSVLQSDWSPLKNRIVTVWPDNDKPGQQAAEAIRTILPTVKVVALPTDLPEKWDLADPIPEGFDPHQSLEEAVAISGPVIRDVATWLQLPSPPQNPILCPLFDVGDKVFTIGGSKTRKSFFVLQGALSLASGRDFLGFRVTRPWRVAVAQYEIKPDNYKKRILKMAGAMNLKLSEFPERMLILNCRGHDMTLDKLRQQIEDFCPEVLIIDPLYKVYDDDHEENSAGATAAMMKKIDALIEKSGTAVWIIHHDAKSGGAEQNHTARGAGSGVISRDYDACIILTPHADEPDALVLSAVLRNYPPLPDTTIRWRDDRFIEAPDILPKPETMATRRAKQQRGPPDEHIINIVKGWFNDSPISSTLLQSRIKNTFAVGEKRAGSIVALMVESEQYVRYRNPKTKKIEIKVNLNSASSAISQNAEIAELQTCPRPTHSAPLIYKGARSCEGDGGRRKLGTKRKLGI